MAQTYKFGNGTWATKKGSTLAYSDTNNAFKPLPFSFERNSIATRVNKEGLIEVVGNDIPRIDYTDSTDGALLLENSSTNYVENSELTNTWTYTEFGSGSAGTITTGKTDMFGGTNAVQIDFPSDAENVGILFGSSLSGLTSGNCNISIYVKLVESGNKNLQLRAGFKDIVNVNSTEFTRVDLSGTKTNNEAFNLKLRPSEGTSSGGFSIIVCHPQEENNSYASSYIPTNGSTVQRAAETCNDSGNSEVFNDSQGVVFADIAANADDNSFRQIAVSNGTYLNSVRFLYRNTIGQFSFYLMSGGVEQLYHTVVSGTQKTPLKAAFQYKLNDCSCWYNGFKIHTDTSATMPLGLDRINFAQGDTGNPFYGKTKEIAYYDEILTDEELEYMTSYRSLNEMVTELNLNAL